MRRMIVAITAVAALSSTVAAAQPYPYGYYGNRDYYQRQQAYQREQERREYERRSYYGAYGYDHHWRRGEVYPYWRDDGYVLNDYYAYGLPPPRPGYRYYRDDNGDVVMAAIAGGIVGLVLGGALNDHHGHRYRH